MSDARRCRPGDAQQEDISYWRVGLGYALVGIGVGFAGTPSSHALTGSVPVSRAGMASGTADLQQDLGGAIMQSILGALLTAGYAAAVASAIADAPHESEITASVRSELSNSFASAAATAEAYPRYSSQITAAARESFLQGDQWAYTAGIVAILVGATIVLLLFPQREQERALTAAYRAQDSARGDAVGEAAGTTPDVPLRSPQEDAGDGGAHQVRQRSRQDGAQP